MYHAKDIIVDFSPHASFNEPLRRIFRPRIYISYREDVPDAVVDAFATNLFNHYNQQRAFIKVVSLRASDHLSDHLERALKHCDVFILLVGNGTFEPGVIHANNDWLRHEIAVALRRYRRKQCVIVPLLVGSARLPVADALPEDIRQLAKIPAEPFHPNLPPRLTQRIAQKTRRKRVVFSARVISVAALGALAAFVGNVANPGLSIPAIHTAPDEGIVAPQSTTTIRAVCPADSVLLSGGYRLPDTSGNAQVIEPLASYPADQFTWAITIGNQFDTDLRMSAIAVCVANSTIMPTIVQSNQTTRQGQSTAMCPAGMVATGGGYDFSLGSLGTVISTGFTGLDSGAPNLQGWSITTSGVPAGATQTAYALCVAGSTHVVLGTPSNLTLSQGAMPTEANASCASGHAIGGSYRVAASSGAANVIAQGSQPGSGNNTWQLTFYNADLVSDQSVQYWPICSSFTPTISFLHQYNIPVPFWQT